MAPAIIMGLAQLAPSLIRYFSGNEMAATVAEKVVGIAQDITGVAPEHTVQVLQADPQKLLEFQSQVAERQHELDKAYLADMQNARAMQMAALGQEDVFSKRFVYYFASAWSLFAMLYFCAVTFIDLPAGGQRVADTVLGVLITSVVGGMFAYFYGTTKNSAEKTRLLAQSTPAKA